MTLGGGIGLMSISVIVAELVMLHCTKEKKLYQKMKTDKLDAEGEEIGVENEEKDDITALSEVNNVKIPKFPVTPDLNESIALNKKPHELGNKKPRKSNGFIQKV